MQNGNLLLTGAESRVALKELNLLILNAIQRSAVPGEGFGLSHTGQKQNLKIGHVFTFR